MKIISLPGFFSVSLLISLVGAQSIIPTAAAFAHAIDGVWQADKETSSALVLKSIGIDNLIEEGGDYENAQFIAEHTDLYDTWYYQGDLVQEIHAIRPDLKVVVYCKVRAVYTTGGETAKWLLKDQNGSYIYSLAYPDSYFLADIGDLEYQDYVASWIKSQIDQYGFDGVFADWGVDAGGGLEYELSGHAVNPRSGKLYTTEEWVNGTLTMAKKIKMKIGSKLYVGNGIHDGDKWLRNKETYLKFFDLPIDGLMAEGCFTLSQNESSWKNSLDFMVWVQDNFLSNRANGVFLPICELRGATNEQIKYLFCSCLLGVRDFSKNYLWMSGVTCSKYTQDLFKIDLGTPEGEYYVLQDYVYARNFTKAKVLVNPTSNTYTVEVNGQSITMLPQTGTIINLYAPAPTNTAYYLILIIILLGSLLGLLLARRRFKPLRILELCRMNICATRESCKFAARVCTYSQLYNKMPFDRMNFESCCYG
jgi:hypothetical protein